ncbi:MAG: DUF885 domain-containing protein [Bacteroidetes bacterium]|nr:DUF885 domain-containing protein [Bacteroidota bacterium]
MKQLISLLLILTSFACNEMVEKKAEVANNDALHELFSTYWEERMQLFPLEATAIGDNRYNNLLPITISESYRNKLLVFYTRYLSESKRINVSLNEKDLISKELFEYEMQINLDALQFPSHLMPINQFWSFTLEFPQLGSGTGNQPFKTVTDYTHFLSRMKSFPAWVDTAIANMRKGIALGYVLPKTLTLKVLPQIKNMCRENIDENIFYKPIQNFPSSFSAEDRKMLTSAYREVIANTIISSYAKLYTFMETEYVKASRSSSGISALPNGDQYYQYLIRQFTTTQLSPDSIYKLGLREVDSLQTEMEKVKNEVQFAGSLQDFFKYMNEDQQFYPFKTEKEVLDSFMAIQKTEELYLKSLFETNPKTSFEIRQTEAYRAASASAEYNAGSEDGSRPGIFYVPILNPKKFNCVGMETLFLHEAIPGHHYQISLQQENNELPKFRKFLGYSAYAEGWALYTETLGKELGLYKNPYQYFGHLSDAMHRAIRLVVDVAIHTKNMSREDAIRYMKSHERISEEEATAEIERYMAIPGQALSYKIGQITLSEMKAKYQKQLGKEFKIGAFHTQLLEGGNMPLDVLQKKLALWAKSF